MTTYPTTRSLFATLGACALAGALGACADTSGSTNPTKTVTVTASPSETDAAETTDAATPAPKPKAKDFTIRLRIRSQTCFGSAGCNATYEIDPAYHGQGGFGGSKWEVTYKVIGGDSGPQINTFTINKAGTAHYDREESISTPPTPHLTAVVTAVYKY